MDNIEYLGMGNMDRISRALEKNRARRPRSKNFLDQLEDRIKSQPLENIEYTQTHQIQVPQNVLSENRVIAGNRSDPRAAAFKFLRTQVLHAMRNNNWSSLAITGPQADIGKSLVAVNLAVSMSLEVNQTVLLVDLDLRHPSLNRYFGFDPEFGIADYLRGEIEIKKLFVSPGFQRLVLVPGKGTTSDSSELLSSPKMTDLSRELQNRYSNRIVIFDLPPLLNIDDAMVFLPNVDSTLLVVENGKNTESDVTKSMRLLAGTNLIGTVLNKAEDEILDYY